MVNTNAVNGLGTHPSYKLVPGGAFPAMFDPESPIFQRATVIGHTLWVTPNHPDERWPAGEFVNQSVRDTGLAEWTKADRPIENTDVVLWYVSASTTSPGRRTGRDARRRGVVLAQAIRILRPAIRRSTSSGPRPTCATAEAHSAGH